MSASFTAKQIRDVNTRYHDIAATAYDTKWGIDFGDVGQTQVVEKLRKVFSNDIPSFERSLEVGCGTGYFTLNLLQLGVIKRAACCDISPGMVKQLRANAKQLGLRVTAKTADAENLPWPDNSFNLVFGHAVLHHIPDLDRAFTEFYRVLKPGGVVLFAGEPSRVGDSLARIPKQAAQVVAPLWRTALRVKPSPEPSTARQHEEDELERVVDVHAFIPEQLKHHVTGAGFQGVDVIGEELVANWFGWTNRSLESTADPQTIPTGWFQYAYHGYRMLQKADSMLFERRLPAALFYNLMLAASKPEKISANSYD